jgi:hypothetical protein
MGAPAGRDMGKMSRGEPETYSARAHRRDLGNLEDQALGQGLAAREKTGAGARATWEEPHGWARSAQRSRGTAGRSGRPRRVRREERAPGRTERAPSTATGGEDRRAEKEDECALREREGTARRSREGRSRAQGAGHGDKNSTVRRRRDAGAEAS